MGDAIRRVATEAAPAAIGPYAQAVRIEGGAMVFASGQIPLDPTTGELVGRTAAEQTRQVMANLRAVLAAAGATMDDVVRTTVYLVDLDDYAAVNAEYGRWFHPDRVPARAAVQVARLPRDARVEIDAIAVVPRQP